MNVNVGVHLQEGRKAGQRFREGKCTKTPAIVKDFRALQLEELRPPQPPTLEGGLK